MPDFRQSGSIATLHDLGTMSEERLEALLEAATRRYPMGLVLPVTAADMHAEPFGRILTELEQVRFIDQTVVVLGVTDRVEDYRSALGHAVRLGERAKVLWTDGERLRRLYDVLAQAGMKVAIPGKGLAVWTAFGYLLADPRLEAYVLHDCDIANYSRGMVARLCLPLAAIGFDFEFCKAYYARFGDRMYRRVARILVSPLIGSLMSILGPQPFLVYLDGFRYPLAGEFALTASLARSNRIPSDWGLEIGTLAEVFRNISSKRICQVDLWPSYEHKHQPLSAGDPDQGLTRMATDILTTLFRTLASMGLVLQPGDFVALRSAYLRSAQDAIRQYHADSLFNDLAFDRDVEEGIAETFAERIAVAAEVFRTDPAGGQALPNWTRVLAAFPDFPERLREAVRDDEREFG